MITRSFISRFLSPLARVSAVMAAALMLASAAHGQAADQQDAGRKSEVVMFAVDVAEDFTKFVPTKVKPEDTQPERGSFFVTEGRIFPVGTIEGDGADFDPGQRGHVGVWICRGTHLVAGSEIPAASWWVDSAQLFVLGRQAKEQLTTEGLEGSGTVTRVVTGGTGNYAGWTGEQRQTFLGLNATGGVNLRVWFILRPPAK
jgi:hypothetical protein